MEAINPYQSPDDPPTDAPDLRPALGVLSGRRKDLRRVAFAQKGIPVWIAMSSGSVLLILATLPQWGWLTRRQELYFVIGLGVLSLGNLAAIVCSYYIGRLIYGWPKGLGLALLMGYPVLTVVGLVVINRSANKVLRQNGLRVGYFGARLADLDA